MAATRRTRRYHRPGTIPGTVYLIHAETPLGNDRHSARHYMGFAVRLRDRILSHRSDAEIVTPAIVHAFNARKIEWRVVRAWTSEPSLDVSGLSAVAVPLLVETLPGVTERMERRLKRRHNHADLCPICSAKPQPGGERKPKIKGKGN